MKINVEIIKEFLKNNPNKITELINISEKYGDDQLLRFLKEIMNNDIKLSKSEIRFDDYILPLSISEKILNFSTIRNKKFLFYGRPGTGKTLASEIMSEKYNIKMRKISAFDIISPHLGESLKALYSYINENNDKEIILIDEIDGLINTRFNLNESEEIHRLTAGMINIFDKKFENKTFIFTTNFFDKIDPALLRRFDWKINFDVYSNENLLEIYYDALSKNYIYRNLDSINPNITKAFFKKNYIDFLNKNAEKTPFNYVSLLLKMDEFYKETKILNLYMLFENFLPNSLSINETIEKFVNSGFNENEIYLILKKHFDGLKQKDVKEIYKNAKNN